MIESPRVIFCAGMKRSGSTLQFNFVREIIQASGQQVATAFQTPAEFTRNWKDGHYADAQTILIKTHQADFSDVFMAGLRPLITYTYRDLRDVYLSGKEKFGWNGKEDLCRMLDEAVENYSRVRELPDDVCLIQSYEQLYNDRRRSILELAKFLSLPLQDSMADEICGHYSIHRIKEQIDSNRKQRIYLIYRKIERNTPGFIRRLLKKSSWLRDVKNKIRSSKVDDSTMFHADHISSRQGVPGQWKNYLEASEIALIEERYSEFLVDNGYTQ